MLLRYRPNPNTGETPTFQEAGDRWDCTRQNVSYHHNRAMHMIKDYLEERMGEFPEEFEALTQILE
jgi:hypothetical protein